MGSVLTGLKQKLARFTPKQMVATGLLVTLIIGSAFGLTRWLTAPSYDVLFSGLEPADAAAVVEAVEASGTPYQLTESGTTSTVLVPAEDVSRLRMTLAADNLPGDSVVGYELLDGQGVTVSTFREQVNYQRALEGELSRTLMSLENVDAASVHIVLPRERLYTEDQEPATASVTVTTTSTLDKDEVTAITRLVAASVPGLDPAQVTVTDANGQLLTGAGADAVSGEEQEVEAAYAARLEGRATSMLASVVGEGKAVVRVQTDLDFTRRTRQEELFDPEKVAANKQKKEGENYTSTEPLPQGTLTTNPTPGATPESTSEYQRTSEDTDFSVSRSITSETDAPGAVKRMTVSVLLDPAAAASTDATAVQTLVENAVGFDAQRGDQIAVELIPFAKSDTKAPVDPALVAAKAAEKTKMIVGLAVAGVLGLAVLVLAVFMLKGRRKGKDKDATGVPTPGGPSAAVASLAGTLDPNAPLGVPSTSGEADRLRERISEHPDVAAEAIRGMLASDKVNR